MDPLQFVANTRVAVVAGKGGVGKTTVTAVLARSAISRGLRVLVVELDGKPTLANLLPDVQVLHLTASAALAEYLDTHGFGAITKRLSRTGIIEVVASAGPGIDDIVVLGKIKQLETSGDWDLIVVDGPAAGHAVTLLMAPAGMSSTMRSGPIHHQANDVAAMLTDPARCQVVLVTLPETTPVNECIDTAYALEERVGVQLGPVVVNAVDLGDQLPDGEAPAGSGLRAAAEFRNARRSLHAREMARLSDQLALPQLVLPQVPGSVLDPAAVNTLATSWGGNG